MKALLRFCLCLALLGSTAATAKLGETYEITPAKSSITFSIHQFLGVIMASSVRSPGTVEVDRAHPERSSVEAAIEVKSIDTESRCGTSICAARNFRHREIPANHVQEPGCETNWAANWRYRWGADHAWITRPITLHVKLLSPLQADGVSPRTHWMVRPDPIKRGDFNLLFGKGAEAISGIGQEVTSEISIEATR